MEPNEQTGKAALISFLKDPRFWAPLLVLACFEGFLQTPVYKKLLDPQSYADNINRIVETVQRSKLRPDVFILGTSVAYQGISVRQLNQDLGHLNVTAQSGACQGAKLMTQHAIYRAVKPNLPKLKYVILVSEVSFPWTARRDIDEPNLSMIAQLDRPIAYGIAHDYGMRLSFQDRLYLTARSVTYQRDLRSFVLRPGKRLKRLSRKFREPPSDYVYENKEHFRISAYSTTNLDECIASATRGIPTRNAKGELVTDRHHRNAVKQTCFVGRDDPMLHPGGPQWTQLFFNRLALLHHEIRQDGRVPITVFMPYSTLISDLNADKRLETWHENLKKMYRGEPYHLLDLRGALDGPDNGDLFYDTIHLNADGAARFTKILAKRLEPLLTKRKSDAAGH